MSRLASLYARAALAVAALAPAARADLFYSQDNLASDVAGLAAHTDASLKNPWGASFGPTTPVWVSNQVMGNTTLYDGQGTPQALIVTIPGPPSNPTGAGRPTGQVFNSTASDFVLSDGAKATFLFASLNGTITGWNGAAGTTALQAAATTGGIYTGLALANNGSGNFLYAANARGSVDVFDGSFHATTLAGGFNDPNLPTGFTPYGIHAIGQTMYVTYENRNAPGGVVDAFDLNGNFLRRVAANGAGGPLDEPWGMAQAPSTFGPFANALLVGNKGDGHISAFDPTSGAFLGQLADANGLALANTGLWEIWFGSGARNFDPNKLYFVAGINGETDGLFGSIAAVPEPGSLVLLALGGSALAGLGLRGRRRIPRS